MTISSNIPADIYGKILDAEKSIEPSGRVRYYPYFELQGGELAIAVVGVKSGKKRKGTRRCLYIKKATVHIVGNPICYHRDIWLHGMGGYRIDFYKEPSRETAKKEVILNAYDENEWYECDAKYFRIYNADRRIINLEFLQTLPEYKYCGYDGSVDALDYLNKYRENPKMELISKLVSPRLAKSKAITARAEKDKRFATWLKINADVIKSTKADIPTITKAYTHNISVEDAQHSVNLDRYLSSRHSYYWNKNSLYEVLFKKNEQQKRERLQEYLTANKIEAQGYIDYLKALKEIKLDLTDSKNLFPNDWKYWLNIRLNQYATIIAEKTKKGKQELSRKIKAIAEKYAALTYGDGEYVVILADSKESLEFEGKILNHCVGRMDYDQRIIKEQSLIFFIREKETANTPLVTVEFSISRQTVLQCYGKNDLPPPKKIQDFVYDTFALRAAKALSKIKKAKAA